MANKVPASVGTVPEGYDQYELLKNWGALGKSLWRGATYLPRLMAAVERGEVAVPVGPRMVQPVPKGTLIDELGRRVNKHGEPVVLQPQEGIAAAASFLGASGMVPGAASQNQLNIGLNDALGRLLNKRAIKRMTTELGALKHTDAAAKDLDPLYAGAKLRRGAELGLRSLPQEALDVIDNIKWNYSLTNIFGAYSPKRKTVYLNPTRLATNDQPMGKAMETVTHEITHGVQRAGGIASSGPAVRELLEQVQNVDDLLDNLRASPEMERMIYFMNPLERQARAMSRTGSNMALTGTPYREPLTDELLIESGKKLKQLSPKDYNRLLIATGEEALEDPTKAALYLTKEHKARLVQSGAGDVVNDAINFVKSSRWP